MAPPGPLPLPPPRAPTTGPARSADPVAVGFVAVAYLVVTEPEAIGFQRFLPVAFVAALLALHVAVRSGASLSAIRVPVPMLLLVVWLGLTAFWSAEPSATVSRLLASTVVVLMGCTVGSALGLRTVVAGFVAGGVLIVVLSLGVAVVAPGSGLMPPGYQGGALRGLYSHRNLLAVDLAPALLAAVVFRPRGALRRLRHVAAIGVVGIGVVLTSASTAIVALMAGLLIGLSLAIARRSPLRHRVVALVVAVLLTGSLAGTALALQDALLALLGRDPTLTNRTPIWAAVRDLIAERPILGWGWGGTWDEGNYVRQRVSSLVTFDVPSAHNGYLDAWLQTGAVGLVLFLLPLAAVLWWGARRLVLDGQDVGLWAPVFVVTMLVYNVSEASLVTSLTLFICASTLAGMAADRARAGGPSDGTGPGGQPRTARSA